MISAKQKQLTPQGQKQWLKLSSWSQLREWHKKWTPSIDDILFRSFMKAYCGQATKLHKEGKLLPIHKFMLSQTGENESSEQQQQEFIQRDQLRISTTPIIIQNQAPKQEPLK